jgi:hypothetical protein
MFALTSPLRGIISHLSERGGGNVHNHQLITITANRLLNNRSDYTAKNAAELTANSYFIQPTNRISGFATISIG